MWHSNMTGIRVIHRGRMLTRMRRNDCFRIGLFVFFVIYFAGLCLFASSYIRVPRFRPVFLRFLSQRGKQVQDFEIPGEPIRDSDNSTVEMFKSAEEFKRNYEEMERKLKVFVYSCDKDYRDFYYYPPHIVLGRYSSEGFFFENMKETRFRTLNITEANLFLIPISCHKMVEKAFSVSRMTTIIENYINSLIFKYPYWNRSSGADHFFVACHENCIRASEEVSLLMNSSIRVLCSPYDDAGYIPDKDVSLPQVMKPFDCEDGRNGRNHGPENRTILGLWGGPMHSYIREKMIELLVKDPEFDLDQIAYREKFARSKYCICHGVTQIGTCIADSIYCGCVPVIFSSYSELPFSDVLEWDKFSVVILNEDEVYKLKGKLPLLLEYLSLQEGLVKVQKHFQWNSPPKRFDAFHMVMCDIWLRIREKTTG